MFSNLSICQHSAEKRNWFGTRDSHFLKCSIWPVGVPEQNKQKTQLEEIFFFITDTGKHINNAIQTPGTHILKHLHKKQCN